MGVHSFQSPSRPDNMKSDLPFSGRVTTRKMAKGQAGNTSSLVGPWPRADLNRKEYETAPPRVRGRG